MKRSRVFFATAVLSLTACGGHSGQDSVKTDQDYANAMDVGRDSFDQTRSDQARQQFGAAYDRALLRDDRLAIRDAGYNMAVATLAAGDAPGALSTVSRVKADLALRGGADHAALDLVSMAALCRLERYEEALEQSRHISTGDTALLERRAFLTGLAADGIGDAGTLATALDALPRSPKPPRLEMADRAELEARLALRHNQPAEAEASALRAVDLRRDMLDYRSMARALDCASRAALAAGQTERAAAYRERAVQSRAQENPKADK
ncbi:hypothetical protein [Asaia krungthepensis]|uniref:Tetratricopeptide repeat protein n=1 Tax=Asaia krungthepensis NRIC 0535 TaxID=1307925 RepID=A0ABQ0PY68_9PROT|nr:hypothetical protein [Asaia krungthepensis]GBQ84565.1 hypothetical protein AA0535_0529 [Asaia krungthepensis NRIC 0535]